MNSNAILRSRRQACALLLTALACLACGDDNGPEEQQTGTVLTATVTSFQAQAVPGGFGLAATEGVRVEIGSKAGVTDSDGQVTLRAFPLGNQNVDFSRDASSATLLLTDVEAGDSYDFLFSINGPNVSTQHTGTWVGEGGSTDPSSQGFVTITMIIAQNGNALSGTASIPPPDATTWTISGKETGQSVDGTFTVVTSNSECASDGSFQGAFTADTLSATFVEVRPSDWTQAQIDACGPVESGQFRLVKQ